MAEELAGEEVQARFLPSVQVCGRRDDDEELEDVSMPGSTLHFTPKGLYPRSTRPEESL